MGEWDNTAYLRTGDLATVERALTDLFAAEGYDPVRRPPRRQSERYDSMQYGDAAGNRRWALALFPGAPGWSVVKTAPFELLCEPVAAGQNPRLAALAVALGCDALQLNLYDGDSVVLLESAADGRVGVSGFRGAADDPLDFHGLRIAPKRLQAGFHLVRVPAELAAAVRAGPVEAWQAAAVTLGGPSAAECDNGVQVERLIPCQPIAEPGRALYFERRPSGLERRRPLELGLVVEDWHGVERLRLRTPGGGEAWVTDHALSAPDRVQGGLFVAAIAGWLETPAPAPPAVAGLLEGSFCTLEPAAPEGDRTVGWDSRTLAVGARHMVELGLRLQRRLGIAELAERDEGQRARLVAELATVLRDGPHARAKARRGPPSLVVEPRRLLDEPAGYLLGTWAGGRFVASGWRGGNSVLWVWDELGRPPREVCMLPGLVSELQPVPPGDGQAGPTGRSVAAVLVDRGGRRPGIGSHDPARIMLIDLERGSTRALEVVAAGAGHLRVSPDGGRIAWGPIGRPMQVVLYDLASRTRRAESPLDFRGQPVWWDESGLFVDVYVQAESAHRLFVWSEAAGFVPAGEVSHRSPDGRFRVEPETGALRVVDLDGAVRHVKGGAGLGRPVLGSLLRRQPAWLGGHRLILPAAPSAQHVVLDLATLERRPLLPPGEVDVPMPSPDGALVVVRQHGGDLLWGSALPQK